MVKIARRILEALTYGRATRTRFLSMGSLASIAVLWLAVAPPVYADEIVPASGSSANVLTPVSIRVADDNTFIDYTYVERWQGTIDGTRVGSGSLVIHPDGSVNAQASGVFTGTIAGRSGTALLRISVSGTLVSAAGNFSMTDGTGGLAGVHAEGTDAAFPTGPTSFGATYSAVVHFSAP